MSKSKKHQQRQQNSPESIIRPFIVIHKQSVGYVHWCFNSLFSCMFVCVHKYDAYHKSSQVWYRDVDSQCNLVLHRSSYALCITKDCVWNHSTRESTQRVKRCKQLWSEWLLPGNLSSQTQWPWNATGMRAAPLPRRDCSRSLYFWKKKLMTLPSSPDFTSIIASSASSHQHATFFLHIKPKELVRVKDAWRFTFNTRMGLHKVSATTEEANPIKACLTCLPYLAGKLVKVWRSPQISMGSLL